MGSRCLARQVENAMQSTNRVGGRRRENMEPSLADCKQCVTCGQPPWQTNARMDWVGLPAGVRFDPTDEQLLGHLAAKMGIGSSRSHPLIDDFISVLEGEDGICQTHPENLPGVTRDGSSRHFFHRPAMAYTTGTRKRRKIHSDHDEHGVETRWHKTGKTRPVIENGVTIGWKKIMVLYRNTGKKKAKPEKTNWILHQYHLGANEEEKDGELVVCKVFYQKQPRQCVSGARLSEGMNQGPKETSITCVSEVSRGTPVTPKTDAPLRPRSSRQAHKGVSNFHLPGEVASATLPVTFSRGSELTAIGNDDQNSIPAPSDHALGGGLLCPTFLGNKLPTLHEVYLTDCETADEEAASGKTCENDQVGMMVAHRGDHIIPYIGESQLPEEDDHDILDLDDLLLCNEKLRGDPLFYDSSRLDVDLRNCAYAVGCSMEEQLIGVEHMPFSTFPTLDDISLDTPPAFLEDLAGSSQENLDWVTRKVFLDDNLDNTDSLSST